MNGQTLYRLEFQKRIAFSYQGPTIHRESLTTLLVLIKIGEAFRLYNKMKEPHKHITIAKKYFFGKYPFG